MIWSLSCGRCHAVVVMRSWSYGRGHTVESPPAAQTAEAAAKAAAKDAAAQARKRKRKKEKKAKKKERKKRTAKERWKDAAARTKPRSFVLWVSASAPQLTYAAGLRAFAAHEILTHVVRWSNEERQPWAHARPVERSPGRSQNTLLGIECRCMSQLRPRFSLYTLLRLIVTGSGSACARSPTARARRPPVRQEIPRGHRTAEMSHGQAAVQSV